MMEYCRWTTQDLASLKLGHRIAAVCTPELHEHCMKAAKGCTSVLKRGSMSFEGDTDTERALNRERAAKEAQAQCRKVKVVISDTPALDASPGFDHEGKPEVK